MKPLNMRPNETSGFLFTFCGLDGCGKTTMLSAVVLSAVWVIATADINGLQEAASAIFTAVTQGVLVAGASVYANQLYIQAKKEE